MIHHADELGWLVQININFPIEQLASWSCESAQWSNYSKKKKKNIKIDSGSEHRTPKSLLSLLLFENRLFSVVTTIVFSYSLNSKCKISIVSQRGRKNINIRLFPNNTVGDIYCSAITLLQRENITNKKKIRKIIQRSIRINNSSRKTVCDLSSMSSARVANKTVNYDL